MERYFRDGAPKLGFGLMRLPYKDGQVDIPQTCEMVDMFMAAGQTYFDTAYVYGENGASEKAAKAALVDRYPRESFTLATKLNAHVAKDAESAKKQLEISLERTGAKYFDFYLLHALSDDSAELYEKYGLWDFVKEAKAKGLIRHWGFSFHGSTQLLEQLLTDHPDTEFVQLQINYADWENPQVASRINYETARRHGKPIVVMEPVRGGALAVPPQRVQEILTDANPDVSFASWAIRYVASMDGMMAVLSGMSDVAQMKDNLSYMKEFKPLSAKEQETIARAQEALANVKSIPCTGCHYCTEGCPMQIRIPDIFGARNAELIWERRDEAQRRYNEITRESSKASECVACGQCEGACPQHIGIIEALKECAEQYEAV